MAKTKEELREARKQWFAPMEQKLKEMHTKEDDSLFYYHSSEDRIVLSHAMFWTMTQLQFFKSKMRKEKFFLLLRQYEEEMLDAFLQHDDYFSELLKDVPGVHVHSQPNNGDYDSNYWLCTITIDEDVKVKGQEDAYKTIVTGAVGGAAGVIHAAESAHTDCEPNANVEAMRVALDKAQIEARPVWKPMHKQPCYKDAPAYVNGVSEAIFKVGMCLPAGPYVSDDDVKYIVETIKANIIG